MHTLPLRPPAALLSASLLAWGSPLLADSKPVPREPPASGASEPGNAASAAAKRWGADIELDPIAYALAGFSLHAGITYGKFRLDLGAFGLDIPEFVHEDAGFDQSFSGYGIKLQYFPFAEQAGAFVGLNGAVGHALTELAGTELAERHLEGNTALQVGYRLLLPADFFVAPWISIGYRWGARDVTLGGKTAGADPLTIFPTVHVGRRFR